MTANELRIGNYVNDRLHRKVVIKEIREEHLIFYLSNGNKIKHNIKTFNPIQITNQLLLNLGFEKLIGWDDMVYFNNNGIHIYFCGNHLEDWFEYENEIVIKSIHQLQNLYFSLTGKELE